MARKKREEVVLTQAEARALLMVAEMFWSGDEKVLKESTEPGDRAAYWRAANKVRFGSNARRRRAD